MKKKYQKPEITMFSLRIQETIADSIMDGSIGTEDSIFGDIVEDEGE